MAGLFYHGLFLRETKIYCSFVNKIEKISMVSSSIVFPPEYGEQGEKCIRKLDLLFNAEK
jgi:hypothetical protein